MTEVYRRKRIPKTAQAVANEKEIEFYSIPKGFILWTRYGANHRRRVIPQNNFTARMTKTSPEIVDRKAYHFFVPLISVTCFIAGSKGELIKLSKNTEFSISSKNIQLLIHTDSPAKERKSE